MNGPWIPLLVYGVTCASSLAIRQDQSIDDRAEAAATLAREVARAKKIGNPLSAKDLVPKRPSDKENAFVEFRQSSKLVRSESMQTTINSFHDFVGRKEYSRAEKVSPKLEPLITLARKAAAKPSYLSDRDYDSIVADSFPAQAHCRSLVKTLCFHAMLDFHRGRFANGEANLASAFAISRHIGREPSVISLLVQFATDAVALRTVEQAASENRSNPELLQRLFRTAQGPQVNLIYHLRAEAYQGTTLLRNLDRLDGLDPLAVVSGERPPMKKGSKPLLRAGLPAGLTQRASLARHLALWNDALTQAKKTPDPLTFSRWLESKSLEVQARKGRSYELLQDSFAAFESLGIAVARNRATRETTLALLKVLQFKLENGRYPTDLLEAGVKEVDPFTKQGYKMVIEGENVLVYSVGPNGNDDQGQTGASPKEGEPPLDDISARTDRSSKAYPASKVGTR